MPPYCRVFGALLIASGCAGGEPASHGDGGRVERRSFAWRDGTRRDPLSPDTAATREYMVFAWMPVARPNDGSSLPLLLFSPGLGVSPPAYDSLLSTIARDGYAVLGVAHTYTTPEVVFPDGHVVRSSESRVPFNFATHVSVLAADLVAVLDHVVAARQRGDTLFRRVDVQRVGALGHSYGGAVAAEACHVDSRFRAAMNLDGTMYGNTVLHGVPCPFFLLLSPLPWTQRLRRGHPTYYADRDQRYLHEEMMFDRSARVSWLTVHQLDHMAFTDAAFSPGVAARVASLLGLRLDAARTRELSARYARAFFGHFLRGEPESVDLRRSPYSFAILRVR